jgi:hypothetical protein
MKALVSLYLQSSKPLQKWIYPDLEKFGKGPKKIHGFSLPYTLSFLIYFNYTLFEKQGVLVAPFHLCWLFEVDDILFSIFDVFVNFEANLF